MGDFLNIETLEEAMSEISDVKYFLGVDKLEDDRHAYCLFRRTGSGEDQIILAKDMRAGTEFDTEVLNIRKIFGETNLQYIEFDYKAAKPTQPRKDPEYITGYDNSDWDKSMTFSSLNDEAYKQEDNSIGGFSKDW